MQISTDLDAAESTFLDKANPMADNPSSPASQPQPQYSSPSQMYDSPSPFRSRSPSPPPASRSYGLRSTANPNAGGSDTGGEKSGMIMVESPPKSNDEIFNEARRAEEAMPSSSSGSFAGDVSSSSTPEIVTHNLTFWRDGFTVDDGPLRKLWHTENASFLVSLTKSECPKELEPADTRIKIVRVNQRRKAENFRIEPCTSKQLGLADGTRMVSQFNNLQTIRDVRDFIHASRLDGQSPDLDQRTLEFRIQS